MPSCKAPVESSVTAAQGARTPVLMCKFHAENETPLMLRTLDARPRAGQYCSKEWLGVPELTR